LAFATRTASVLVDDFCFGDGAFVNFPPIDVGAFEVCPTGCVLIGPVTGLTLDMLDNWMRPNSFKWPGRFLVGRRFRRKSKAAAGISATALRDHMKVASAMRPSD
jgi:hypothetical protein